MIRSTVGALLAEHANVLKPKKKLLNNCCCRASWLDPCAFLKPYLYDACRTAGRRAPKKYKSLKLNHLPRCVTKDVLLSKIRKVKKFGREI
jgi:hypothetical protein